MNNNNEARLREDLERDGKLLLRDLTMSMKDFEQLLSSQFRAYHLSATRADRITDSTDGYSNLVFSTGRLLGHAEGYYRPCLPPPDVCMFWCKKAPQNNGGETSWIDGAELYRKLQPELAQRLGEEGIIYEMSWMPDRWRAEFGVDNKTALRHLLDSDDRCQYELSESGELRILFKTHAITVDKNGTKRFVNGLLAHLPEITHPHYSDKSVYCKPSNKIRWGSGELIDNITVNKLLDASDAALRKHRWKDNDVLILDNHRMLHGRELMASSDQRIIYSRFGFWR